MKSQKTMDSQKRTESQKKWKQKFSELKNFRTQSMSVSDYVSVR